MLRNLILFVLFTGLSFSAFAQSLVGTVTDDLGDPLPGATIVIKNGTITENAGTADLDGKFRIAPISPGTYSVEFSFVGTKTRVFQGVRFSPSKATTLNAQLVEDDGTTLDILELVEEKLIDPDKTGSSKGLEEIQSLPTREIGQIAAVTASVSSSDQGQGLNVKGSRSGQAVYFVDGVKVIGSGAGVPQNALDQVQVITGGVPAEYGDVAAGVISIITRGPSSNTFGGLEFQTSEFLDPFGYNLAEGYFSTPLIQKRDKDGDKVPMVGMFLSANYTRVKDPSYTRYVYSLTDEKKADIAANPWLFSGSSVNPTTQLAGSHIRANDIEKLNYLPNNRSQQINGQAKFDIKIGDNSRLKVGGFYQNTDRNFNSLTRAMFNNDVWANRKETEYRLFATYQQFFDNGEGDESSTIQNAYFTLHTDFTNYSRTTYNDKFGEDYSKYGYSGKFNPVFGEQSARAVIDTGETVAYLNLGTNTWDTAVVENFGGVGGDLLHSVLVKDYLKVPTKYTFEASDLNPGKAQVAQAYFDHLSEFANFSSIESLFANGGVANGNSVSSVYGLYPNVGHIYGSYNKFNQSQFRFTGSANGLIGKHDIKIGFEFEQRVRREWNLGASSLWRVGRSLANEHLVSASGVYYEWDGALTDDDQKILTQYRDFSEDNMSTFAKKFRQNVGVSNRQYLNIDAYDPENLTLDLFSQEEITNNRLLGQYYGYDVYGNSLGNTRVSMEQYLTDSLADGTLKREIGAFQPIYMAGYIQDKFIYEDLVFNVGVRVDRYDANQQVPVDPYILFDHFKANEVDYSNFANYNRPSNIGDDYAVYVDNIDNPTEIKGYRNGDQWFDANGKSITDLQSIYGGSGTPEPYLTEKGKNSGLAKNKGLTGDAFTDYDPDIVVMPRISFNFPITDEALFFAHYDVLTQRPTAGNSIFNPNMYLSLANKSTSGVLELNPNLKMQRNTDYELGFKQALTDISALEISLYYREMRDMIQLTNRKGAYPIEYIQYENLDFGTTKGLTVNYEQRKGKSNLSFSGNYTLQFADGTGSSAGEQRDLLNSQASENVRQILPLSFDSRHQFNLTADYTFPRGERYNGPKSLKKVLEGVSFGLLGTAFTGRPYTSRLFPTAINGSVNNNPVKGDINSSRKPANYRFDLKVTKRFSVNRKKSKKPINMSAYVQINNLLNTQNVFDVHEATGSATDDGWLASDKGQVDASTRLNPQSYIDLYGFRADNPYNFTRPRTIRLGLTFGF
jgi:hypothetical protein